MSKRFLTNSQRSINLVFVSPRQAQALNVKYRQREYIPTVLSFYYGDDEACWGEVVMCLAEAKKQNLTLKTLVNHGLKNLLSQIPTAQLCGVGFTRNRA